MESWLRDIERAATPRDVVALTRDYLATLSPRDLARVPESCRPGRVMDPDDIAFWGARLAEEYWRLRGTPADVAVVQELWGFFLRASVHIARLREPQRAAL